MKRESERQRETWLNKTVDRLSNVDSNTVFWVGDTLVIFRMEESSGVHFPDNKNSEIKGKIQFGERLHKVSH